MKDMKIRVLLFQLKKGNEEGGDCFVMRTTELIYSGIKWRIVQVDVVDIGAMPEFTRRNFSKAKTRRRRFMQRRILHASSRMLDDT